MPQNYAASPQAVPVIGIHGGAGGQRPNSNVLIVHGGAYRVPDAIVAEAKLGAQRAAKAGWEVLSNGGSALDAVEMAVKVLEDTACFNAGTGSCFTSAESIEMDAFIMDGRTMSVGAVTAVDFVRNPIHLARAVMDKTNHCVFTSHGAKALAEKMHMEIVPWKELITEHSWRRLREFREFESTVSQSFSTRGEHHNALLNPNADEHDTVGAVALDMHGNVASATSTGGITGKLPGRVGDTPLCGSGGFADNDLGAVSTTGHGEAILRVCLSHRCAQNMREMTASEAAKEAITFMEKRVNGAAGLISVDRTGNVGVHFNTERMTWAYVKEDRLHCGVLPGEDEEVDVASIQ